MKSIKVQGTKKVHRLHDLSWIHNSDLKMISCKEQDKFFADEEWYKNNNKGVEVTIMEEGLKIPFGRCEDKDYLDTCIEYKGNRYYTQRELIRDEEETEEKEIFIPDLHGFTETLNGGSICYHIRNYTTNFCPDVECSDCIFYSDNAKYFRR